MVSLSPRGFSVPRYRHKYSARTNPYYLNCHGSHCAIIEDTPVEMEDGRQIHHAQINSISPSVEYLRICPLNNQVPFTPPSRSLGLSTGYVDANPRRALPAMPRSRARSLPLFTLKYPTHPPPPVSRSHLSTIPTTPTTGTSTYGAQISMNSVSQCRVRSPCISSCSKAKAPALEARL